MNEETKKYVDAPICKVSDFAPSDNARRKGRFAQQEIQTIVEANKQQQ